MAYRIEPSPFGELRVGEAAYEAACTPHLGSSADIQLLVTYTEAEIALARSMGGARSLALGWVQPSGRIPHSHVRMLYSGGEARETAKVGHAFVLVDMDLAQASPDADVVIAALPREAILASYVPRRKDPSGNDHCLAIRATSGAVGALAGVAASATVDAVYQPREGAVAAIHWIVRDEAGALCDVALLAKYIENAGRREEARTTINPANQAFARRVAPSAGARALLHVLGFRPEGESLRVASPDRLLFEEVVRRLRTNAGEDDYLDQCDPGGEGGGGGFLNSTSRWRTGDRRNFNGRRPPPPPPGAAPSSNGAWGRG